jgi:ATP-binding cassette subfamily B protein
LVLFLFSFVATGIGILEANLFRILIDNAFINSNLIILVYVLLAYIGTFVFSKFLNAITIYTKQKLNNQIKYRSISIIFNKYLNIHMQDLDNFELGDRKIRIEDDVNYLNTFINDQILGFCICLTQLIIYTILVISINWIIALIMFITIPATFLLSRLLSKMMHELNKETRDINNHYNSWLQNTIIRWREIKSFLLERKQLQKFTEYQWELAKLGNRWALLQGILTNTYVFIFQFILSMGLYFLGG